MSYDEFSVLAVTEADGVVHLTLDNPPVNVIDVPVISELTAFATRVRTDERVRVIVVQSANPDYFAAHADIDFMFRPEALGALAVPGADARLNPLQQMNELFRTLPQITIAKLRGRLRAGGAELAMAADLRFAAAGATFLGQPETRMGIFPGGGGTQYLNRLVGRARTLEIVLGAELYGTDLAERYGWINRALPDDQLDAYVDALALRIASLPAGVAEAAKEAIDAAEAGGPVPDLAVEGASHAKVYPSPDYIVDRMRRAMAAGAQTADGETDLEGLLDRVS